MLLFIYPEDQLRRELREGWLIGRLFIERSLHQEREVFGDVFET